MIKLGLTGNIGSGKTTVSKIFESLNIPVFYADTEAKALYDLKQVKETINSIFGSSIFNNSGEVDFKLLANIVFSDKSKLEQLTGILHPLVFEKYQEWVEENTLAPYSIHESAIIFEYSQQKYFDKTICVTAPLELRVKRVLKRDNTSLEKIKERVNNQMDETKKTGLSDIIIINDEKSFLIPQIMEIHNKMKK